LGAGYGDRELPSSRCQLEGDLYRILDRGSALWPLRTCPPLPGIEDRAEQVAQPSESAQIFKGEATAPTRSCACEAACPRTRATHRREGPVAAHLVVLLSLRLVAEDRIRFRDLLEALCRRFIVRVRIRVVLLRELAVCLLDLIGASIFRHAQDLVEVLRCCRHSYSTWRHQAPAPAAARAIIRASVPGPAPDAAAAPGIGIRSGRPRLSYRPPPADRWGQSSMPHGVQGRRRHPVPRSSPTPQPPVHGVACAPPSAPLPGALPRWCSPP